MIARATAAACAAVALGGPAVAQHATAPVPLAVRLAGLADGFCLDVLSGKVVLPAGLAANRPVLARYGLVPGAPVPAMRALGGSDNPLFARATVVSGEAGDGAFIVALGGTAGESCRIAVYRAPADRRFVEATFAAMKLPATKWRALPNPTQPPDTLKVSLIKRDAANRPYLANLYAPMGRGPVAAVLVVAVIPPDVTVPEGF